MNIIVCLDEKNGMLFNKRRQSSDKVLRERILTLAKESRLLMNTYSAKQFEGFDADITVDDNFLNAASQGDYCFVENTDVTAFKESIEKVIIYRWNRTYPSDVKFPISVFCDRWSLVSTFDFAGNSHEKITEEIYTL